MRFDEMELQPAVLDLDVPLVAEAPAEPVIVAANTPAPRFRRLLALLTDLSLFAALALALSPLLPASQSPLSVGALAGFVIVVSYYYFAGSWLLWGKTVGGAIFDVRVVPAGAPAMALGNASKRWIALMLSLVTGGIGLMFAALPSRLSIPDRVSGTRCVTG